MKESNFSSRLSMFRQNKNMTQEELAGRMGVTPQALSKWERGHSLPDILLLKELCRILEISADDLLGIENRKITENGNGLHKKKSGTNYKIVWSHWSVFSEKIWSLHFWMGHIRKKL